MACERGREEPQPLAVESAQEWCTLLPAKPVAPFKFGPRSSPWDLVQVQAGNREGSPEPEGTGSNHEDLSSSKEKGETSILYSIRTTSLLVGAIHIRVGLPFPFAGLPVNHLQTHPQLFFFEGWVRGLNSPPYQESP